MRLRGFTIGAMPYAGIVISYTDEVGEMQAFDDLGHPYPMTPELLSAIQAEEYRCAHKPSHRTDREQDYDEMQRQRHGNPSDGGERD